MILWPQGRPFPHVFQALIIVIREKGGGLQFYL